MLCVLCVVCCVSCCACVCVVCVCVCHKQANESWVHRVIGFFDFFEVGSPFVPSVIHFSFTHSRALSLEANIFLVGSLTKTLPWLKNS